MNFIIVIACSWLLSLTHILCMLSCLDPPHHFPNGADWDCKNITTRPMTPLNYCVFNESSQIICDKLGVSESHQFIINYTIYFYGRFTFVIMNNTLTENEDESITYCLGLTEIHYKKISLPHPWTNVTFGVYRDSDFLFLSVFDKFELLFNMNGNVPVATISLNKTCLLQSVNRSSSCILNVHILREITSLNSSISIVDNKPYWDMLRCTYITILQAETKMFYIDTNVLLSDVDQKIPYNFMSALEPVRIHIEGVHLLVLQNILPNAPQLISAEFPRCSLGGISAGQLQNSPNLKNLVLSDNNLQDLPIDMATLKELQKLDLSANKELLCYSKTLIKKLNNILNNLTNLEWLNLSGIDMTCGELPGAVFTNKTTYFLNKLDTLNISNCKLSNLTSSNMFETMLSLRVLDLSKNNLAELPSTLLVNLKNSAYIHLAFNQFSDNFQLLLNSERIIDVIDLSHNKIVIPNILLEGKVNLLDLSYNKIVSWNNTKIFNNVKVNQLNISYNKLGSLSEELINSLENVNTVDLGSNLIDCKDCRMPSFKQWLNESHRFPVIINLGSTQPLTCMAPANLLGQALSRYKFDPSWCLEPEAINYMLVVGVPVGVIIIITVILTSTLYKYRFEVTYIFKKTIWKNKKKTAISDIQQFVFDAFVCYSRSDRWVIEKLSSNLEKSAEKYKLCLHERDFPLGSLIFDNIEDSLRISQFVIVVLSKSFLNSQWCRWELDMANHAVLQEEKDHMILVELEKLERKKLPRRLCFLLETQTYLEWHKYSNNEEICWKRIKEALGPSIYTRNLMLSERSPLLESADI